VGGLGADFFLRFAVANPELPPLKGGLSAFLVEREMGMEVVEKYRMMGYTNKYPVESFFRMARLGRIASGTSEVMQYIVQRDLYKEILGRKQPVYEAM
jgi:alkylation response protein AidB-like acyl-CoA dehydrogenase